MTSYLAVTSILLSAAGLAGGLFVFSKSPKSATNRIFLLLTVATMAWSLVYIGIEHASPDNIDHSRFLNSLSYALALLFSYVAVWLSQYFPKKLDSNKQTLNLGIFVMPLVFLSFSSFISGTVDYSIESSDYVYTYSPGIILYVIALLASMFLIAKNLLSGYKQADAQKHKTQIKLVLLGLIIAVVVGIAFGVVLPIVAPDTQLDDVAPLSIVLFIYFAAKAIIQVRLYDFKISVAKTLAVIVNFILITLVYFAVASLLETLVLKESNFVLELILSVIFVSLLIFSYDRLNRATEKTILKLFIKDSYEAQNLLDELNQEIVKESELEDLLINSAQIIQQSMHASSCGFYIRETAYFKSRYIAKGKRKISDNDLEKVRQITPSIRYKVHSTEIEPDSNEEKILNDILKSNKLEILGRLVDTTEYNVAGVGYILLGPKRSGSLYSEQDLKVLEIIANELVIAVENALRLEEIEQFNVTLQKKIDSATKELKMSNEKLKALDEAKDEFVSMASHQLRTPLTSIKGYISMVLEGDAGKINDTQKQMLGQAFFSSQRMVYLISDLLNVSRLKTGKFLIETRSVDLPELVANEIEQLQEGAAAKNITLTYKKPKKFPTLNLDDMKIRQVVMNFTDNAIYYTPNNGKITVELKETPKAVEFTVKDSGIGVPKDQQHKLFTKFYRADNARKARPDGTGLGLFMAKKVIVAQGGSIIFKSTEGKGSTFGFSFPKSKVVEK